MSIEKLREFDKKSKEVIERRRFLQQMSQEATKELPKLPTYSKGTFTLYFTTSNSGNSHNVPELGQPVIQRGEGQGIQDIRCWGDDLLEDKPSELSLKNLRDILCKCLGNPTQEELDSVKVE